MKIVTSEIAQPTISQKLFPVDLSQTTMEERKNNLLTKMKEHQLDTIFIYADREHGSNFEYLTGFIPRFEEACLVVHSNGSAFLLLGNENTKMGSYSRIAAEVIHVPYFSLPNQPMEDDAPFTSYLVQAGIHEDSRLGLIGWKNFTTAYQDNRSLFDLPHFIVSGLEKLVASPAQLMNYADLLIGPSDGLRTVNNANEIAHYEYGAALAGQCILTTLNRIKLGKTELDLAETLAASGQPHSVTTICATGDRFTNAVLYPRNKQVQLGDTFSLTTGYKGGLSSRAAYVAQSPKDLPAAVQDYEEKIAQPYYQAFVTWLETIRIGMTGKELFDTIQTILPKENYHWELNPGHFTADEEWMASPFCEGSTSILKSGQLFQIDIIPKVKGYGGVSCEDGIVLADNELRAEIQKEYPEMWERFSKRRDYIINELNIQLSEDILPLNDIVAYYRPFLLNQNLAFSVKK
ncbi:M24 family metallopeptidase [Enterococcus sp. BWB1-3]|uniref:M24 family metallopeptidase n=1 Tax=unclassified Enterococcus TaxID=2608891 RepID=UPI0019250D83|nr:MULTISPECIES: aminopeptidase P family protein [unclassified Enterococcus]MBL1229165.1 M24 family metallopeptidase [Enterococcus sp. BWB1-3]MCB5953413.1 aminopeptidase P family N-terminal domain-containing protein [Enterococcus sp. CWB-B31]